MSPDEILSPAPMATTGSWLDVTEQNPRTMLSAENTIENLPILSMATKAPSAPVEIIRSVNALTAADSSVRWRYRARSAIVCAVCWQMHRSWVLTPLMATWLSAHAEAPMHPHSLIWPSLRPITPPEELAAATLPRLSMATAPTPQLG
ncbi:hypothetical protein EC988_008504 [Linderina pennispora]|nr:hypothetical protein EC988_008504 [Linderina pennispora]